LVDKSLVREQDGRFSMLETIREYALERLTETDYAEEARSRHAEYFLTNAEANRGDLYDALDPDQIDWFERERDNLRVALDRLHQLGEPEHELRLVVACYPFWKGCGYWTEARQRIGAALRRAGETAPALRARALLYAAHLAWRQGEADRGKELSEAALALHDELGTSGRALVHAHIELAICEQKLGNHERALEVYEVASAVAHEAGDERMVAVVGHNLGNLALDERDFARARTFFEESVAINRRLGVKAYLANSLMDLGFVAFGEARVEEAAASFRESLGICRAERLAAPLVLAVEGLAAVALERDSPADAARLLSATTRPRDELGFAADFYPVGDEVRGRTLAAARAKLGEEAFAAAWADGEGLSVEGAAEKAAAIG
jgi:tetratricopeptide (TPR) repeat protein